MSSGKWRPFCFGLNVLIDPHRYRQTLQESSGPAHDRILSACMWLNYRISEKYHGEFQFQHLSM